MRRNAGFTLIEIMVVIAIIAAILGGVTLMIRGATAARMKTVAKTQVTTLGAALEQLKDPERLGMYPPTRLEDVRSPSLGVLKAKVGGLNDVNRGIETVYVAVRLKGMNVDVSGFEDNALANLDEDKMSEAVPDLKSNELYEYVDPWGNPYVYIHNRDYKDLKGVERYMLGDGREVKVTLKTLTNGEYVGATSFQLFSMGPDGQPGTDDDIHYGQ